MATGFTVAQVGNYKADIDDILIRREYFSDGNLWGWGYNQSGMLGVGSNNISSPIQTIAGGTNWKQVACGSNLSAGIKSDGSLWMMGSSVAGGLGDNTSTDKSSPVQTITGGTNWKYAACGYSNTAAAIKTDGTLWVWGQNAYGMLGDGTNSNRSSPVQTITGGSNWSQIACGYHMVAVKTDGTLWCWGRDQYGQLGDGTVTDKSSPVQTVSSGTNWKQVACSTQHTAAIKTDGTLWVWGYNNYGQLGDGTITNKSSPVQTVSSGTNWKQVACGNGTTGSIKTDGTIWVWGRDAYGSLGDMSSVHKSSPVTVSGGGTNWKMVSCGGGNMAAIKTDGSLWVWGSNGNGQLGKNTITSGVSSPVQTVMGSTNWKQVSVSISMNSMMALTDLSF